MNQPEGAGARAGHRWARALGRVFAPPHYPDEQERRSAALANAVLWVTLAGTVAYGLGTLRLPVPWTGRIPLLVAALVPALGLLALRRGWLRATSAVLCATFLLVPTWGAIDSGGVRAPSVTTLFLAVVLAGQLLGVTAALVSAALSAIAVIVLVQLGARGLLPPPRILHSDGTYGVAMGLELIALGAFSAFAARLMRNMIHRLRDEQQAQRALEAQLNDARRLEYIGRLAGGVAHDFNNVLTVILGNADIGLRSPSRAPEQQRVLLEEIRQAGERAALLTRQLLTFARRQRVERRVVDAGECLNRMEPFLRRLIPENIELELSVAEGLRVNIDPGQLEQVVVNLVGNARDAMAQGGRLSVRLHEVRLPAGHARAPLPPGRYAVLAVGDTGGGMAPEVLPHLFEPFFTTKSAGSGTGLGLATVWNVATESGGRVFVSSRPGVGSTFEVFLPAVDGAASATPASARQVAGGETVLLVDDQAQVRQVVARALERHGYRVLVASSADEADRLSDSQPGARLLLSDLVMPGDSGPSLARRLRARNPELAVLFMSGYAEEAIGGDSRSVPGARFIAKPFTPDALVARVREILDGSAAP